MRKLAVSFEPHGKDSHVPVGTTLFNAAHWIGLPIDSTCGARGTCGKCKVQVLEGETELTHADRTKLTEEELAQGWRLSCQARAQEDTCCFIPALMRVPKAATMGTGRLVLLEPNVKKVYVELAEPTLEDQRSDFERLRDALAEEGYGVEPAPHALRSLPAALRASRFQATAVLGGDRLVTVEPGDTRGVSYGAAFDLGTTTVVGALMNLTTGMSAGVESTLNGQAPFGADVITRISHAMAGPDDLEELRGALLETVNGLLAGLYREAGVGPEHVYELVAVGNATMLHLLLGVDPSPISVTPFVPAFREPLDLPAKDVGVDIHPDARVHTFPIIGAYVGADIVAGILSSGLARDEELRLFVDVGTNGEIVLGSSEWVFATSAPAGPAFEGAEIRCGMRAAEGAIEGVALGESVELQVIGGDVRPQGICGSGLVDAVAQLRLAGLLDVSGRLRSAEEVPGHPLAGHLATIGEERAFLLADGIPLFQKDVRELQFAKGAIASGIQVLMDRAGVTPGDLDEILLAGSFGTYIQPESARIIGLVPPVPVERIRSVGNAAVEGAKMALVAYPERLIAYDLPSVVDYVELSGRPEFNELFVSALAFPELEALELEAVP